MSAISEVREPSLANLSGLHGSLVVWGGFFKGEDALEDCVETLVVLQRRTQFVLAYTVALDDGFLKITGL